MDIQPERFDMSHESPSTLEVIGSGMPNLAFNVFGSDIQTILMVARRSLHGLGNLDTRVKSSAFTITIA